MNKTIEKRWIDALPNYTQGRQSLRVDDPLSEGGFRHCCLGVLCELYAEETGEEIWTGSDGHVEGYKCSTGDGNASSGYLPAKIRRWAGITTQDETRLIQYNDSFMYDFGQIAEAIENGIPQIEVPV